MRPSFAERKVGQEDQTEMKLEFSDCLSASPCSSCCTRDGGAVQLDFISDSTEAGIDKEKQLNANEHGISNIRRNNDVGLDKETYNYEEKNIYRHTEITINLTDTKRGKLLLMTTV